MATRVKKVNQWYIKYATEHLVLAMDDNTLYCEVISENVEGLSYRVDMDETAMVAKRCQCASRKRCKHMDICDTAFAGYAGYVAPVEVVEPVAKITEVEAGQWYIINSNTQVFKTDDGQWMAVGPTTSAIELVEAHIASQKQDEMPAQQPVVVSPVVVKEEAKPEPAYTMSAEKLAMLTGQAVIVEESAEAPKDNVTDIGQRGSLNSAQHAASFWEMLPSRKKNIA